MLSEESLLAGVPGVGKCEILSSRLLSMLPYIKPTAYKLWDLRSKTAITVGRFLTDSGATGGLISLQQAKAKRHKLSWQPLEMKIATADGGAAAPVGLLEGVKLIVLPGTALATAVPFDALVMDTSGKGVYDAILGREQMHLLGMVLDFGRQRCYMRPKLRQGCWDLAEVPWICVEDAPTGDVCAVASEVVQSTRLGGGAVGSGTDHRHGRAPDSREGLP